MNEEIKEQKLNKELAERVIAARKEAGLTQSQTAEKTGIKLRRYQRLESFEYKKNLHDIYSFCRALKLPLCKIIK